MDSDFSKSFDDNFVFLNQNYLSLLERKKKRLMNVHCGNCGEKGHIVKDCENPITSFGIIAYRMVYNPSDEVFDLNPELKKIVGANKQDQSVTPSYPRVKFLMIQRKDTMGFIDFVRGKYPDNEEEKLSRLCTYVSEMTNDEKQVLLTQPFDTIWSNMWSNKNSKTYRNEKDNAKHKYSLLNIPDIISSVAKGYEHTEFSFPKGRRNMKETNISCAEREFEEETGYNRNHYDHMTNCQPICEEFIGTNGVQYRHIYYFVKMKKSIPPPSVNCDNVLQSGEVKNIGWFTYSECMNLIRPYDIQKKNVLTKVYNDLLEYRANYRGSNVHESWRNSSNYKPSVFSTGKYFTNGFSRYFTKRQRSSPQQSYQFPFQNTYSQSL